MAASIRKFGLEIRNRCTDCPCFDLFAAAIVNSGPEIKNRCTDCPCFDLLAASIRESGLEIGNQCKDCPCFDLLAASIRKSGLEIENRCTDCPCFDLFAASIRKSGLEIENRCTDCPCFDLFAASIRKSRLEIKNRCNTIVPASITARLQQVLPLRCRVRFYFSSPQSRIARLLLCRGRRGERPACCFIVVAGKNSPPAALLWSHGEWPACRMTVAGAGGDRLPRRRHNPK